MATYKDNSKYGNTYPAQGKYPYSVFKPIPAGFFRQRIVIQRPVQIRPDGQGGVNEKWADLATVWARIETMKDSAHSNIEKFEEMQVRYQQHYSITIRWGRVNPIDTSYRVLYTSGTDPAFTRVFNIIAVVNLDVINWQVNLYVREGGNIG